jgi:hypothetical protein
VAQGVHEVRGSGGRGGGAGQQGRRRGGGALRCKGRRKGGGRAGVAGQARWLGRWWGWQPGRCRSEWFALMMGRGGLDGRAGWWGVGVRQCLYSRPVLSESKVRPTSRPPLTPHPSAPPPAPSTPSQPFLAPFKAAHGGLDPLALMVQQLVAAIPEIGHTDKGGRRGPLAAGCRRLGCALTAAARKWQCSWGLTPLPGPALSAQAGPHCHGDAPNSAPPPPTHKTPAPRPPPQAPT